MSRKTPLEVIPDKPFSEMSDQELYSFRDEWQHLGNCYKKPRLTDIMFASPGFDEENAKNICNGGKVTIDGVTADVPECKVRKTCLIWARLTKQPGGIWGGKRFDTAEGRQSS
jgi:hypothetical protein